MFMNFDLKETEDVWTWQHSPVILVLDIRRQEDQPGLVDWHPKKDLSPLNPALSGQRQEDL